ncbi:MAG: C39 family peptidase [Puniceicoccales bacterium]|nr:C39 family peptidase [Puniceicoccales bacterium]
MILFSFNCVGIAETLEQLVFEPKWLERNMTNFPQDMAGLDFKWDVDEENPDKKESASSRKAGELLGQKALQVTVLCDQGHLLGINTILYLPPPSMDGESDEAGHQKVFASIAAELEKKFGSKGEQLKHSIGVNMRWYAKDSVYDLKGLPMMIEYREKDKTTKRLTYTVWLATYPSLEILVFSPKLWEQSGTRFAEQNAMMGFQWTSASKDSARSAWPGKFMGIDIPEAIVRVKSEKLASIDLSLFNRGDSGESKFPDSKSFAEFVQEVRAALDKKLDAKATPRPSDSRNVSRTEGVIWKGPHAYYLLEWNETRANPSRRIPYHAEFLRLSVAPAVSTTEAGVPKQWKGTDHLKTESNGDKYIYDVPMVDQGQKGYCAVAVAERVLRYYGKDVDQHEIAKLAGSSSSMGTSIDELHAALKSISSKLRLRTKTIFEPDERFVRSMVNDYNKAAKRMKKDQVVLGAGWENSLDKDVLKESRSKDRSALNRFERNIETYVDQGKPLLWSVYIGWAPEPKILPQTRGGHMRLIIGYNKKESEIIFTDTWGAGHEMKKMKLEDAWTMTRGLGVMEPSL